MILTSADRLRARYGAAGERAVLAAIARLDAARAARGAASRLMLIEQGDPRLGVLPAVLAPESVAAQIAALAQALERAGAPLESVLVVGGPEIVPFYAAANPTMYDGDDTVPGDCYYGACNPFALVPDWVVGRIPGAGGADPSLLLRLLDYAAQPPAPHPPIKVFGYATAAWRRSSARVYAEIDRPERLLLSPPTLAANLDLQQLEGARLIYCNLHGVLEGPPWYGQAEEQQALVVALRPADLAGLDQRGAMVSSEACYGAMIAGRDEHSSMALAFLARGAAGFVGATAISYGPAAPPPGEADLVALHFLRALKQPGTTLGAAFVAARAGMLRDTLARQQTLDEDDQKPLLEFVLDGDPTFVVV
jgi:hypothetical protein